MPQNHADSQDESVSDSLFLRIFRRKERAGGKSGKAGAVVPTRKDYRRLLEEREQYRLASREYQQKYEACQADRAHQAESGRTLQQSLARLCADLSGIAADAAAGRPIRLDPGNYGGELHETAAHIETALQAARGGTAAGTPLQPRPGAAVPPKADRTLSPAGAEYFRFFDGMTDLLNAADTAGRIEADRLYPIYLQAADSLDAVAEHVLKPLGRIKEMVGHMKVNDFSCRIPERFEGTVGEIADSLNHVCDIMAVV